MGIRVNPNVYSVLLQGLQLTTQQEDQALEQISSGQQINSLSDNPSGAATLVESSTAIGSGYSVSAKYFPLTGSLNVANSALSSVVEALTTAQSAGAKEAINFKRVQPAGAGAADSGDPAADPWAGQYDLQRPIHFLRNRHQYPALCR